MKRHLFAAVIVAISVISLAGCANEPATTATGGDAADRTYNRNELQNTGRMQSSDALQAADPSIQTSSGRR